MSEQSIEPVIDVRNLVTYYGPRKILDDVDFVVNPGEIRVIMGGSGSGKSTLMRHLLGLHIPRSGVIKLLGRDIAKMDPREGMAFRREIGVSFQGGALFTSMSVGENVALPLREHFKLDENTIRIMTRLKLEVVNLGGFQDLMPSTLAKSLSGEDMDAVVAYLMAQQ